MTSTVPCGLYEYFLDKDGKSHLPYFNDKILEIYDVTAAELESDASIIWRLIHPDDRERIAQAYIKANASGDLFFVETRIVTRAGCEKWVQMSSLPTGEKIDNSVVSSGYCLDITASKLHQDKFESLMKAIPDLILLIDEDGRYLQTNDSEYLNLFFPEDSSIIGKTMHEVLPQNIADSFLEFIRKVINTNGNSFIEYPLQALNNKIYWFESRTRALNEKVNGKRITLSAIRDITAKNREKEEQIEAEKNLRAAAIEETKSQERSLLIKDMHDGLGSQLTYARMMIENKKIDQLGLLEIVQDCIADLYLIIDTLSEEDTSFHDALIDFRYRIQKRLEGGPIHVHWDIKLEDSPLLPQRLTLEVLRILQEALNNSLRHAKAELITISAGFEVSTGNILLTVSDDGVGFVAPTAQGRGLRNMKNRARDIGGVLDISYTPLGTSVSLTFKS
jgi:PAS domain S-box-containing protein